MTRPNPAVPLAVTPAPPAENSPRIYVACLAAYNHGHLHGCWIPATQPDEIMQAVRAMLASSPVPDAEEWAIHDHEGFEGAEIAEYAGFQTVCDLAEFILAHGRLAACLHRHFAGDLAAARAAFEDHAGQYGSLGEFAESLHRETGTDIPQALQPYIDWQALGRDMELSGDIMTLRTGIDALHVFWSQ